MNLKIFAVAVRLRTYNCGRGVDADMIVKLFADAERLRVSICGCGADADSQVLSAQVSVMNNSAS